MKEKRVKRDEKELSIVKYRLLPEFITCPDCGFDLDIWSEEYETRCIICGHRFFRRGATIH
ncbi:MAG: hypothetical protein HZA17_15300 [Nitrospirae bacterium]|nr:hypothetical protein [Nitrospirota bacterium]